MSLERNTDLPANLRNGLNAEQQDMVRGLFNTLVYEQNMNTAEAEQMATQMLQTSGMVYDGKWNVVKNEAAVGVITKIDEDKRLVFGWASIIKDTEGKVLLDRQNDFIDSEDELEKSAYTYVLHSRDGGEMHVRKGVSTMVESVVLTKEKQESLGIPAGTVPIGWWIGFRVNDERVWDEVKKGGYAGFSVHGTGQRNETKLNAGEFTEIEKTSVAKENVPADMELYNRVKAATKAKFDVYPSAYANGWLVQEYKRRGGTYKTGVKKCDEPALRVASRFIELLTKSQKSKMSKGEGPGHPFRGNQWGSKGSKGGGRGAGNSESMSMKPTGGKGRKGAITPKGLAERKEKAKQALANAPKPAGKGEYKTSETSGGNISLRIKESALPKKVLDIHRKAQGIKEGQYDPKTGVTDSVTLHTDMASAKKAIKNPAQSLVTHYKQVASRAKEGLLDSTGGGMAGKRMRDGRLSTFNTANTALSELAALGYE